MVDKDEVDDWLAGLPDVICGFQADGVEFLLYYSGCDPHVHDPMIKGVMTTEQMRLREKAVFRTTKALGLPVCWSLGGGYQKPWEKMVELHGLSMEECIAAYRNVSPDDILASHVS